MKELEKSTLIAPCHFDKSVVDFIANENISHTNLKVSELYGAVSNEIIRHGRSREAVKSITRNEAVEFKKYLDEKNLGFIYLLNAPFDFDDSERSRYEVEEYLDWVVNEVQPEAVTISSHDLAKFVRNRYESLKIYVSTIAAVANVDDYNKWLDIDPSRIVLQYDQNRNWKNLSLLAKHSENSVAEIELMLNESCLRNCINRQGHYNALGATNKGEDRPFLTTCNSRKIFYPYEYLKSNYIRPEDMSIYEEMGIKRFKITGRSKPSEWLPEVIKAYQGRKFGGNIIRLLGIDPSLGAENWININNPALDGFLDNFTNEDEDSYAEKWIQKLYKDGNFTVSDGTEYEVGNSGILMPNKLGKIALRVVKNETE